MLNKIEFGSKKAGLSIEISISIVLVVAVFAFAIDIFGSSIESMAKNGNMSNMVQHFTKHNVDRTYFEKKYDANSGGTDPTATQVNVQLVAEQGLNYYIKSAMSTIEKYEQTDVSKMTQSQIEDVAKALAIVQTVSSLDSNMQTLKNNCGISFANSKNINRYYISITNPNTQAESTLTYEVTNNNEIEKSQITTIKNIQNASWK